MRTGKETGKSKCTHACLENYPLAPVLALRHFLAFFFGLGVETAGGVGVLPQRMGWGQNSVRSSHLLCLKHMDFLEKRGDWYRFTLSIFLSVYIRGQ